MVVARWSALCPSLAGPLIASSSQCWHRSAGDRSTQAMRKNLSCVFFNICLKFFLSTPSLRIPWPSKMLKLFVKLLLAICRQGLEVNCFTLKQTIQSLLIPWNVKTMRRNLFLKGIFYCFHKSQDLRCFWNIYWKVYWY